MKDYTERIMLIYNPKHKNVLNIINYSNNSFNIKNPKKNPPTIIKKSHSLELENIGEICNDGKPKCICFTYEGKDGLYEYTDDNKMLYEVYSEFRSKYGWAPEGGRLMLTKNDNMLDLDEFKSLRDNGINDKDSICIIND